MANSPATEFNDQLLSEVLEGLQRPQKYLPCKLFYDETGSRLFDRICELDEYYPTRTEAQIMRDHLDEITAVFGPDTLLVEFGSGSSTKTRLLLDHLPNLAGYVPIDISETHLLASARDLQAEYPELDIYPLPADYTRPIRLPVIRRPVQRRIAFFPGSTIGNFTRREAGEFLVGIAAMCGARGGLLIGVDLQKDHAVLEAAYNDAEGVTAAFNLNILDHLNRLFDADFNPARFRHQAFYNEPHGRIEMHLVSRAGQVVTVAGRPIGFRRGETILTEHSHKYTPEGFARLAADAFRVERVWTDPRRYFSLQYLVVNP